LSTKDISGGAAIAAFRLHNAMLKAGIESKYLVLYRTINDRDDILTVSKYQKYIINTINIIRDKITLRTLNRTRGKFSSFKYGINISKYSEILSADIIYLHWVCSSFIDFRILTNILKLKKTVFWFMHDMFPITGGCHHSFECGKYYTYCNKCAYFQGIFPLKDLAAWQYKKKKYIYKRFDNIAFIAPSTWLFDCAKKSGLTKDNQVYHIPNLVDTSVFRPLNKTFARQVFSLEGIYKVIGFGADSALTNPYKGWKYMQEALRILAQNDSLKDMRIMILIFGSSYNKEIADDIPFICHFLGYLHDDYTLSMLYNVMDVFVVPSLADNFPNTILESLAANTPVVAFNVGGIPDTVNNNTGYLAEYQNSEDLARGLSLILLNHKKDVHNFISPFIIDAILKQHKNILYAPPPLQHTQYD
jgi:glycosyltransferase involved in cell wall biosynthesis